ncbi:MAG TPA: hypothetical protein VK790_13020 [Solirubrobacteraceae bacterium]|jgi:hypothetical protein|nr:hypothetical protein [Solirubrobacteraceae bacterium]
MRIARLESRRRRVRSAALTALLAAMSLAFAQPAVANVGEQIVLRCTHNESLGGFSQSAYRQALKELAADTEEYSDCSSRIHEAQLAAASKGRGGGGGSGQGTGAPVSIAATPAEQRAISHAARAGSEPVTLGGGVIHPGVVHVDVAHALSSLPTPLLATLIFLLACLLLVAAGALGKRVRARGSG